MENLCEEILNKLILLKDSQKSPSNIIKESFDLLVNYLNFDESQIYTLKELFQTKLISIISIEQIDKNSQIINQLNFTIGLYNILVVFYFILVQQDNLSVLTFVLLRKIVSFSDKGILKKQLVYSLSNIKEFEKMFQYAISRMENEIKFIKQKQLEGEMNQITLIKLRKNFETTVQQFILLIQGKEGSFYEGGWFCFLLINPTAFHNDTPQFKNLFPILHCHIYLNGKVCIKTLEQQKWDISETHFWLIKTIENILHKNTNILSLANDSLGKLEYENPNIYNDLIKLQTQFYNQNNPLYQALGISKIIDKIKENKEQGIEDAQDFFLDISL